METQTEHLYVVRDKSILNGEPIIKGTRTPVRVIVEWWRMGIAPEENPIKLPHLSSPMSHFLTDSLIAFNLDLIISILGNDLSFFF